MRGLLFITIFSLLISCNYQISKDLSPEQDSNKLNTPPAESAQISWSLIKTTSLSTCMNCHIGNTSPDLSTRSQVQQNISLVLSETHTNAMPPSKNGYAPLSDCQKALLQTWAEQGTPEISNLRVGDIAACAQSVPPATSPDSSLETAPLNYNTLLTRILQPKCLKCHNPDSEDVEAAGILFFPYQEISQRTRLWAGPGKKSKMVKILTAPDDARMPPPEDGPALSNQEIDFIVRWIDAGKPE